MKENKQDREDRVNVKPLYIYNTGCMWYQVALKEAILGFKHDGEQVTPCHAMRERSATLLWWKDFTFKLDEQAQ